MNRYLLILFCLYSITLSKEIDVVPIAIKVIGYKHIVNATDVKLVNVTDKYSCRKYLKLSLLKEGKYRASHYIRKGRVICDNNVYVSSSNKIKFNFGLLEIEKEGEIIKETSKYIRIKNPDGTIEKIQKGIK